MGLIYLLDASLFKVLFFFLMEPKLPKVVLIPNSLQKTAFDVLFVLITYVSEVTQLPKIEEKKSKHFYRFDFIIDFPRLESHESTVNKLS